MHWLDNLITVQCLLWVHTHSLVRDLARTYDSTDQGPAPPSHLTWSITRRWATLGGCPAALVAPRTRP